MDWFGADLHGLLKVRPGLEELTLIACSTSAGAQKHLEMSGATFAPFRKSARAGTVQGDESTTFPAICN